MARFNLPSVIAYAYNGAVWSNDVTVTKEVAVPANYTYFTHSIRHTTESGSYDERSDIRRDPTGKVIGVSVTAIAHTKNSFGPTSRLGLELTVTVEG